MSLFMPILNIIQDSIEIYFINHLKRYIAQLPRPSHILHDVHFIMA